MQQTFPAERGQRISIAHVAGDLNVRGWDQQVISVTSNGDIGNLQAEGDVVLIHDCEDSVELAVPYEQIITTREIDGDVSIEHVRQVETHGVHGDISLKGITGEVALGNSDGDLVVEDIPHVHARGNINGDVRCERVERLEVSIVGGSLALKDGTEASFHNVTGNVDISSTSSIRGRHIGGDCSLRDIQGNVSLDHVDSSMTVAGVAGNLQIGNIGGNAELKGIRGLLGSNSVGGNAFVETNFPPESVTRLRAGGNIHLVLPSNANLTIQATVGGIVHGHGSVSAMGHHVTLVYGDGAARLEVSAGGNLELYGDQAPKSTSTYSGNRGNFAYNWQDQWQNMAGQWNAASAEFAADLGASFTDGFTRAAEKQQQKAEKYRQKVEKHARRASERAARMNIRVNNREWRLDPQRIDHIIAESYDAAARGTQGAIEAVEQALKNLRVTPPPPPSRPPKPPTPPSSRPPKPPVPPHAPHHVDRDINMDVPPEPPREWENPRTTEKSAVDLEQERIAILRMVADGRITPEEGDMLLEAL